MGAFYGSIIIRTEDLDGVRKALEGLAKGNSSRFLVGPPIRGWISVFPNESQDMGVSAKLAELIPNDLFQLLVHDDDLFAYSFYRKGQLVDEYNTCPDAFGDVPEEEMRLTIAHPERFQDLMSGPEVLGKLQSLLTVSESNKFVYENERMAKFARLLGLPNALGSYEYLQEGERDDIQSWSKFIHVPDLASEKAVKRAAKAQIAAEKKQLKKSGVLLAEIKPPKQKAAGLLASIAWTTNLANGGLLFAWNDVRFGSSNDEQQLELFEIKPPWDSPPRQTALKLNPTIHTIAVSPSGVWVAAGFAYGDWAMQIWDWKSKALVFELPHTSAVHWVDFSKDEQCVYSLGGEKFVVSSLAEKQPIVTVTVPPGDRRAALHPSGTMAVVVYQRQLGILDLEKRQVAKMLWVNRRTETIDLFAMDTTGQVIRSSLETLLASEKIRAKLRIEPEQHASILKDPKAIEDLRPEARDKIKSLLDKVRAQCLRSFEKSEDVFDARFDPEGRLLFLATSDGMRVFEWEKVLSSTGDVFPPELRVDSPPLDEPMHSNFSYCVRFDPTRNVLISSCLSGDIQFLDLRNGRSGVLFKLLGGVMAWRLEITKDLQALCLDCSDRPSRGSDRKHHLQIWNYPALCKSAGLA
jgi:WD40 repeat protein